MLGIARVFQSDIITAPFTWSDIVQFLVTPRQGSYSAPGWIQAGKHKQLKMLQVAALEVLVTSGLVQVSARPSRIAPMWGTLREREGDTWKHLGGRDCDCLRSGRDSIPWVASDHAEMRSLLAATIRELC